MKKTTSHPVMVSQFSLLKRHDGAETVFCGRPPVVCSNLSEYRMETDDRSSRMSDVRFDGDRVWTQHFFGKTQLDGNEGISSLGSKINYLVYREAWQLRIPNIIAWASNLWSFHIGPRTSCPVTQFLLQWLVPPCKTCSITSQLQKTGEQYCLHSPASRWTCLFKCKSAWQFQHNLRFWKINNCGVTPRK